MLDLSKPMELLGLDKPYLVKPEDIVDEGETIWLNETPMWMVSLPRFNKDGSHFDISIYRLINEGDRPVDAAAKA